MTLVVFIPELLVSKVLALKVVVLMSVMLVLGLKVLVALVLSSAWEYTCDHLESWN